MFLQFRNSGDFEGIMTLAVGDEVRDTFAQATGPQVGRPSGSRLV